MDKDPSLFTRNDGHYSNVGEIETFLSKISYLEATLANTKATYQVLLDKERQTKVNVEEKLKDLISSSSTKERNHSLELESLTTHIDRIKNDNIMAERKISDLYMENRQLVHELREKNDHACSLREQLESSRNQNFACDEEIIDLRSRLDTLYQNNTSQLQEFNDLKSRLMTQEKESLGMRSHITDLEEKLSSKSINEDALVLKVSELENELSHTREIPCNMNDIERELLDTKEMLSRALLEQSETSKTIGALRNELHESQQNISLLKLKESDLIEQAKMDALQIKNLNELMIVNKDSLELKDTLAFENESLKNQVRLLEESLLISDEKLEQQKNEIDSSSKAHKELVESLHDEINKIKRETELILIENEEILIELGLQKQEFDMISLEKERQFSKQLESLAEKLNLREQEIFTANVSEEKLRSEISILEHDKRSLVLQLEKAQADSILLSSQMVSLDKREVLCETDSSATEIFEKDQLIHEYKVKLEELHVKINEITINNQNSELEVKCLEVDRLKEEVKKYDVICKRLEDENKKLSSQVEINQELLKSKEDDLSSLAKQLEDSILKCSDSPRKALSIDKIDDPKMLRDLLLSLACELEQSELKRADVLDRLVKERKVHANSLKRLGDSVKRFYTTVSYGEGETS